MKLIKKSTKDKPRRTKNRKILLGVVVIILIFLAIVVTYFVVQKNKQKKPTSQPTPETVIYSTDKPDESKQNADTYNWKGGSNDPKKISIQAIGVDAYVQRMGVDQNKKMATPNNIHLTGWFVDTQQPGQNGLSVIAGHVTGVKGDGVFKNLNKLKTGDTFTVENGDGTVKNFKVIDVKQAKESESADYLFSQQPNIKSQLNLVTCGGKFNSSTRQYEDRIIVISELQ